MSDNVPLPSTSSPPSRGLSTTHFGWPDVVLGGLVLAFAFLVASFPARNSDLWSHLAVGRLLAQGAYDFGIDPFAYTTQGIYWANHSWLFDLGLYGIYQTLGGTVVVLLKAVGVLVLASLMFLLARRDHGPFWISAACILLAVLAMSPRLLLQPACLSLGLLALSLVLLRTGGKAFYALPVVMALWSNLDGWFVLGPLLVALFWLGQALAPQRPATGMTATGRLPVWLLPACILACLINPHHIHTLTLPPELSPLVWTSELRHDERFAHFFASPWQWEALGSGGGWNLAAWAFLVLLVLGGVSFLCHRSALRSWRMPVWLAFAGLAAWQMRLIPFFAVVAGPITALNLRDAFRFAPVSPGRAAILVVSLALIALTWPGWLQGFHRRDRPLAWTVVPDSSLQRAAESLRNWRAEGAIPEGTHVLATHPDMAHYCEWYCPEEKVFLDARLTLFGPVIPDYVALGRLLNLTQGGSEEPQDGERLLRDHAIGLLIVHDPDLRRMAPALREVVAAPDQWELLRIDGQALVLKARHGAPVAVAPFDAEEAVFSENGSALVPPAPEDGPAELLLEIPWMQRYLHPGTGTTWESDAAALYALLFEHRASRPSVSQPDAVTLRSALGLFGASMPPAGEVPTFLGVATLVALNERMLSDAEERPSSLPLLAVRAARRALCAHPDDANAWLVLAQAYLYLDRATNEAASPSGEYGALPPLAEIRRIQIVTALNQAITINPELVAAHERLGALYTEGNYLDLALRHRTIQLDLTRQAGAWPGEEPAAFSSRIKRLEEALKQLRETVHLSENRFVIHTRGMTAEPLARARVALNLGLAGKARDDVLLSSHADLYGVEGLRLLLELLLRTGRPQEARALLDREELRQNPEGLGMYDLSPPRGEARRWGYRFPAYDWFELCQSAATGYYGRASQALALLRGHLEQASEQLMRNLQPGMAWRITSELGTGAEPANFILRAMQHLEAQSITTWLTQAWFVPVERADLFTVEGMLLLEQGRPREAKERFREALRAYASSLQAGAPPLPGQLLARRYGERLR